MNKIMQRQVEIATLIENYKLAFLVANGKPVDALLYEGGRFLLTTHKDYTTKHTKAQLTLGMSELWLRVRDHGWFYVAPYGERAVWNTNNWAIYQGHGLRQKAHMTFCGDRYKKGDCAAKRREAYAMCNRLNGFMITENDFPEAA